jgi:transcriptional regulator with XRE-family HTH domain
MSTTDQVLSEFIDAWNAGRRPSAREYLARVPDGPDRDELADQITSWLEIAPTPAYSDGVRSDIAAEPFVAQLLASASSDAGLWPAVVPELRARAGLSVRDLAARLVDRLALDSSDVPRTIGYLERLEGGGLDPTRVSRRLLDALGGLLGVPGRGLLDSASFGRGLRPAAAGGAIFRSDGAADPSVRDDIEALSRAALTPAPTPMDELDRLFTGGPEA